jgi:DNA-binding LacI/PurR family transcriptional regulator
MGEGTVADPLESLALGVLHEAQRRGLRLPEQLGICSAVDSGSLQLTSPQVTAVYVYPRDLGRTAAQALIDLIEATTKPPARIKIPVHLNPRHSTNRSG